MQRIKTILISLVAIMAAGTPATRADELSDLVAAVAASVQKGLIEKDVVTPFNNNSKPRYQARNTSTEISSGMLDGILSSMKREAFRKMRKEVYGELDPPLDNLNEDLSTYRNFYRPVPGMITSTFGWRPTFHRVHHGVDLALQIGDTVRCAVSGTVSLISYDHDGYGHYVVLTNQDGMETLYGHLEYPLVAQGQYIYTGMPIGIGGNTGNSTGPHLHFEARLGGIAVDPLLLFDFNVINNFINTSEETSSSTHSPKTPTFSHQQKSLAKESTYIVRTGDTLESIARQAGISVMRLCQLNMLSASDPLPLGRMLKLK